MNKVGMTFNILIRKEDESFVAHCLELDIVAAAETAEEAEKDILSLIAAQVEYAFENDNLDNLYHPAPPEVWREYFSCETTHEKEYRTEETRRDKISSVLPPWLVAKTCIVSSDPCHA